MLREGQNCWGDAGGGKWQLLDELSGANFERDGDEILPPSLYVELGPRNYHFFRCLHSKAT